MFFIETETGLQVKLPLTQPTGMARVKERREISNIGKPVATRRKPFNENCYVEWQIAYDTLDIQNSLNRISFGRLKLSDGIVQIKYLFELSDFLLSAIKLLLLKEDTLDDLLLFASKVSTSDFIEVNCPPHRSYQGTKEFDKITFNIYNQDLPVLVHQTGNYIIELMVQPKQRAVGNQAMLFFDIPLTELKEWDSRNGRIALPKEEGTLIIDSGNSQILISLMKCFMLSSAQHKADIINIINAIKSNI